IEQAKENIVLRRDTHIDQLTDKLREDRVRRVIQPILAARERPELLAEDDVQYVEDLGLIKTEGQLRIGNKIYHEIIPRSLTYTTQLTISQESEWYVKPEDGRLDMNRLLSAFQQFFREHSEHWVERFDYKEAGPQLLMQAFLQRIVNRGGRIEREYGLGRMRTDLLVIWPVGAHGAEGKAQSARDVQKVVIELKVLYKSLERTVAEGLEQTVAYMDRCGTDEGYLVIFDRGKDKSWDEKIFRKIETFRKKTIEVWGM
ncbi:MAG: ATP-binding protein, partial [Candidatus Latescibacteria bacterium]|nr:ATP-binding protein [Candidatus Latescibacterota bacterium]